MNLKNLKGSIPGKILSIAGFIIFLIAVLVLYGELRKYSYHSILRHLRELSPGAITAAVALTTLNYMVLACYENLAFRYIRKQIGFLKISFVSFMGYAFSNTLGFSMLSGASIRYRFYSTWGLSAVDITTVMLFNSLTLWLGLLTLNGITLMLHTPVISATYNLMPAKMLGLLFLCIPVAYNLTGIFRKKPFSIFKWEFRFPVFPITLLQVLVSSLDWLLSGSVLYVLLPAHYNIPFWGFMGVFLVAQLSGILSQVPGGLGVFETVIVLLLPGIPANAILGPLIAFRAIYYLLPLCAAVIIFGLQEILDNLEIAKSISRIMGNIVLGLSPGILAFMAFLGGAVLVFSGALPHSKGWMLYFNNFIPLPLIEFSHFIGSIAGVALLILARALQRKLNAAYYMSLIMLGAGIIFSLLKGFNYHEAVILSVMFFILLPSRKYFYRKASILSGQFTLGWTIAIVTVVVCSVWLGLFSFKHVDYRKELWWHFSISGDAPRFLRATTGIICFSLFFALRKLLNTVRSKQPAPSTNDMEIVKNLVRNSENTYANLALLGDKSFMFNEKKTSFIMYGVSRQSWISMNDPIGPEEDFKDILWQFKETCDINAVRPVFYQIDNRYIPLYLDVGFSFFKIGEEAIISIESFSIETQGKSLQRTVKKMAEAGFTAELIPPEGVPGILPALKNISDAWLQTKHTREKGFSLGFFDNNYLSSLPVFIAKKDSNIIAFANLWLGANKKEYSIDLMRYLPSSQGSVMDYLITEILLWGKANGYRQFNMGMVSLSGLENKPVAPLWDRIGSSIYRNGEFFYNFKGLRHYKEKYNPVWQSKYIALTSGLALPQILLDISMLTSRGLKGMILK